VKSSKTNHIPRRADRFTLITRNNPLWPIRVDVGAEEALLHQLLGVLGNERGNQPWLIGEGWEAFWWWRRRREERVEKMTMQGKEEGFKLQRV
jgi:hypothetical protein